MVHFSLLLAIHSTYGAFDKHWSKTNRLSENLVIIRDNFKYFFIETLVVGTH